MSFSWFKQHNNNKTANKSKTPTILVTHYIKPTTNINPKDHIPRHRELTPDPADDFVMTNAANRAVRGKPKKDNKKILKSSLDVLNINFKFNTSYKELISMKTDKYLNKILIIKYFSEQHEMVLQGRLTCISHCGVYRIENVTYKDGIDTNKLNLSYNYWLHFNSTRKIYVSDYKCYKKRETAKQLDSIDITQKFCDIIKFKMVNYLFYQSDNSVAYELSTEIFNFDDFKKHISKFVKNELTNNDFKYLKRADWDRKPVYLKDEDLVSMVLSYRDLITTYFESLTEIDAFYSQKDNKKNDEMRFQYFNWV